MPGTFASASVPERSSSTNRSSWSKHSSQVSCSPSGPSSRASRPRDREGFGQLTRVLGALRNRRRARPWRAGLGVRDESRATSGRAHRTPGRADLRVQRSARRHGCSARPSIGVEGRQNARRNLGRAASVEQLEHGVQVDLGVLGEPSGQTWGTPRGDEAAATPLDDGVGLQERSDGVAVEAHTGLASAAPQALPSRDSSGHGILANVMDRRRGSVPQTRPVLRASAGPRRRAGMQCCATLRSSSRSRS
jgi:hypothetical protein